MYILFNYLNKYSLCIEQKVISAAQFLLSPKLNFTYICGDRNNQLIFMNYLSNWRPLECDGSINMNIMKPIDPQVRAILYEDAPSFINAESIYA